MPASKKKKKGYFDAELTCKLLIEECESLRSWDKFFWEWMAKVEDKSNTKMNTLCAWNLVLTGIVAFALVVSLYSLGGM